MSSRNFPCNTRAGQTFSVTTSSQTFQPGSNADEKAFYKAAVDWLFDNRGGAACYVVAGDSGVGAATVLSIRIPAGAMAVWSKGNSSHFSVIGDGATTLVAHAGVGG